MDDVKYVLGVDLGTTAVKVCLVDQSTREKVLQLSQPTKASLNAGQPRDEQCPEKILLALQYCLSTIERELLNRVTKIAVCGQMHGIVLWKKNAWRYELAKERFSFVKENISCLITWQDRRCTKDFLEGLPQKSSPSFGAVSSGFGCASLFWLLKNGSLSQEYECAGTIQDLVVAMLTDRASPVMTSHNAASFGYFDPEISSWDLGALASADFPCYLLPEIVDESQQAGKLKYFWFSIPPRTPVLAAFGDTQCSALSALQENKNTALLNMGTSSQLSFVCDARETNPRGEYAYFPYFDRRYLCVAASLNGGNILSHLVATLKSWLEDLGTPLPESKIWDRLLSPQCSESPSIRVNPQLFGERHDPDLTGSVLDLTPAIPSLDMTFRATCAGLLENLISTLPIKILKDQSIDSIVCCGKVINHNVVLRTEVERIFADFTVDFGKNCESAYGAALAAIVYTRS